MGKQEITRGNLVFGRWLREKRGSHSQDWVANFIGVTRALVSDVELGKKRFSLTSLSRVANLFDEDFYELAEKTGYKNNEIKERYNLSYPYPLEINSFLQQTHNEIESSQRMRECGNPELSKHQILYWINLIEERVSSDKDDLKRIRDLKFILIRAYSELMACQNDLSLIGSGFSSVINTFSRIQALSFEINDQKGLAIGHTLLAGAYNVDRNFVKAKEHAMQAESFFGDEHSLFAETFRGLMIDNAFLNDLAGYKSYEQKAQDAIESGKINSPTDLSAIFEGVGKSKTIFGDLAAIDNIIKAEKEMNKLNEKRKIMPLRYLQINRSFLKYFEVMKRIGYTLDPNILQCYIEKTQGSLMTLPDYRRYKKEVYSILNVLQTKPMNSQERPTQLSLF